MKTIYQINIEIPTDQLTMRREFYVASRAELECIRDAADRGGDTPNYIVTGFTVAHVMTALEVANEISAEKAKSAAEA